MAGFVVVHHRRDGDQPWSNNWGDDDRLQMITTTAEIAARCEQAHRTGERIYVHRCGLDARPPLICCSVEVESASYDAMAGCVSFSAFEFVGLPPSRKPARGENWYEADPPTSHRKAPFRR
jgi:hypothetical protein